MIGIGFVRDALDRLRQGGHDADAALEAAGIGEADLDLPGFRLSAAQYGRLWLSIAQTLQCEFFCFGTRPMPPGSFVMLCHAVVSGATLEHVLKRSLRFLTLLLGEPGADLIVEGGLARVVLRESTPPRPAFAYRTYFLVLYGLVCWLVKRQLEIRELHFRGSIPEGREDYRDFFGVTVGFDRSQTILSLDRDLLGLRVRQNERTLRAFIAAAPANILVRYRYDRGVAFAVRRLLREQPPTGWPSFAQAAQSIGLSEPTLRRHLRADGQSYKAIKEEARRKLAFDWLARSDKPIGRIATELGYAEPSAFHRAFRKWAETSPGEFRRRSFSRQSGN